MQPAADRLFRRLPIIPIVPIIALLVVPTGCLKGPVTPPPPPDEGPTSQQTTTRTVLLSGQPAPGTAGRVFQGVAVIADDQISPVISAVSATGQVTAIAKLEGGGLGNDIGVWYDNLGSLGLVALNGQSSPGTTVPIENISFPLVSPAGLVSFYGMLVSRPQNYIYPGVWSFQDGRLSLAARVRQAAPGAPAGATFAQSPPRVTTPAFDYPVSVNASGSLAFVSFLDGVPPANNLGAWVGPPDALKPVFINNIPTPEGYVLEGGGQLVINGKGQVGFIANLASSNDQGIFFGFPGQLTRLLKTGDPAPGTGGTFAQFGGFSFMPAINDAGMYCFQGNAADQDGIWARTTGSLEPVAIEGQAAPGLPGWVFEGFSPLIQGPLLDASGRVVFLSSVKEKSTGSLANALYSWTSSGGLSHLVLPGQNAPGTGQTFATDFPVSYSINNAGQVAVFARLASGKEGIWLSLGSQLVLVALQGQPFPVLGQPKMVDDILQMTPGGGQRGRPTSLSENGILTFSLKLDDGTSGVFTAQL